MITSTHLFKFGSYRDAGRNLYRDRARLSDVPGLRFYSMAFTGSRFTEGMNLGLFEPRRQMAWCTWESEEALDLFMRKSPIARHWLDATDEYCELRAVPYRAYGTFRGTKPFAGLAPGKPGDGPIAIWTFANIPPRNLRRFYTRIKHGTERLLPLPGLIAATAGHQHFLTGAITLTLWRSETDATQFAYHLQPHKQIVKDVKRENLLTDSMFIRQRPFRVEGSWPAYSRFDERFEAFTRSVNAEAVTEGAR